MSESGRRCRAIATTRGTIVLAVVALCSGCMSAVHVLPPRDNTEPSDKITTTCPQLGEPIFDLTRVRVVKTLPRPPIGLPPKSPPPILPPRPAPPPPPPPVSKLHPLLRDWLAGPGTARTETLLVTFRETLRIPHFPVLEERSPRSTVLNQSRLDQMQALIETIRTQRDSAFDADSIELVRRFSATVLHRHWLTPSMLVAMPLDRVRGLLRRPNVVYVQPRIGNEPPPSCPSSTTGNGYDDDDPVDARQLIQSDAFRNLKLAYGYMSLLDTGVCDDHCLLTGVKLGVAGDCVNGGADCQASTSPGFDPTDQTARTGGHGTASAALLVGDDSMGDEWRGALDITLDYFQVYSDGDCGTSGLCLNADAALHAFEESLANGDRVIAAELSSLAADWSAVGLSAQNAFDAGAIIVAANGNLGPSDETTTSPASTPCAIGVGAVDIVYRVTDAAQSRGPAYGDRIKPDLQAPTGVETAETKESGCGESSELTHHGGTSGATPLAAAAAALLRNWMKAGGDYVAPGHVYAGMILAGRHHGENLNHTEGAGLIELPTDGCAWWGWTMVNAKNPAASFSLDLALFESDSLEVALWWPEDLAVDAAGLPVIQHNNIDVAVYAPSSSKPAIEGRQVESIFERVTTPVTSKGYWTIEIQGTSFHSTTATQQVYWMAAARRKP